MSHNASTISIIAIAELGWTTAPLICRSSASSVIAQSASPPSPSSRAAIAPVCCSAIAAMLARAAAAACGDQFSTAYPPPKKLDRAARKAAREKKADPTTKDTGTTTKLWVSVGGTTAFLSVGIYSLMADPNESELARSAQSTSVGKWLTANVGEMASTFVNPCREKLLPDWPPDYLNLPPTTQCPHTLVLDLDDTLVHASWDRKFGWRHAKRPGVEQFLRDMAMKYEIVIFSSNIAGVGDPVVNALDREGCAMHRLYRECTHFIRGTHVKDLSKMNRPLSKIVVLDKDPKRSNYNRATSSSCRLTLTRLISPIHISRTSRPSS